MSDLVWHWELTPLEAWCGYSIVEPSKPRSVMLPTSKAPLASPNPVRVEVTPFACAKNALPGEGDFYYQLALSSTSCAAGMHITRDANPSLPESGDRRSGILIFSEDRIAASYVSDGRRAESEMVLVVDKEYAGQRLGRRALLEFSKWVRRRRVTAPQKLSPGGARAFLSTQLAVYDWAVEQGKLVPDKVLQEMKTRKETNQILEVIAQVERTGQSARLEG